MHWIDWTIIGLYLVWIIWDGLRMTKHSGELEGYFLASRSLPWWAVGLSVMATQLSAITMIGTTGQGYQSGMGLLQQYYALPVAMIILSVTLVPFFHNARVFTAYEYLEKRFDAKTRTFTALLFLLSRGMATGVVISAPAVVLSVMLGIDVTTTCLLIGLPTAVYTMFGGVQAVTWTDVKQMYLIVFGLVAAVIALMLGLPDDRERQRRAVPGRRHRPPAGDGLQLRPEHHLHVLVRHARRAVPVPVVLRHRSEPGPALPHREERGRGARVAADERLLEDSAAGAGADHRRLHVPVLRLHAAADAVQPGARSRGPRQRARGRVSGARAAVRRGDRERGARRRRPRRRWRRGATRWRGRCRRPRSSAPTSR